MPKLPKTRNNSGFTLISKACKGFTLIELLVVIAIISSLATLAFIAIQPAQRQARDARRKSDIKQYQTSLEIYANKSSGAYPVHSGGSNPASGALCGELGLTGCPEDPRNAADPSQVYYYQSDAAGSSYVLWAKLEGSTNPINYFVVCSNGKGGVISAGIPPAGGVCPLP